MHITHAPAHAQRDLALVGDIEMVGRHALLNSMYLCGYAQIQRSSTVMLSFKSVLDTQIRTRTHAYVHTSVLVHAYIHDKRTCVHERDMVVFRYSVSLLLRSGACDGSDAAREGWEHLVPMFFLSNSMAFSASASDGNTTLFSQDAHMFELLHTCRIHLYPSTISHASIRLRRYVGTHQGFSGWTSILADLNLHLDRQQSINIHGMRSP